MLPRHLQTTIKSHAQKVCSLYKRAIRNEWNMYDESAELRYHCVVLRARFDKNKDIKDLRKAKQLLEEGERELENKMHYQPRQFSYSPGGINYGRAVPTPDSVLDFWHPLEKAQYPEYFARREQRKLDYVQYFEQRYGKRIEDH